MPVKLFKEGAYALEHMHLVLFRLIKSDSCHICLYEALNRSHLSLRHGLLV